MTLFTAPVPLPLLAHPSQLAELLRDSDARVLFTVGQPAGGPVVVTMSGGAESAYEALLARSSPVAPDVVLCFDDSAVTLVTTPLYTNGTWMTLLPTVAAGATTVLMGDFGARAFLDTVEGERCTHTFMVPTQLTMVLAEPSFDGRDLSSLRIVISAAAPLRTDTKREILRRMTRGLMGLYGMTEGVGTVLQPEDMERKDRVGGPPSPAPRSASSTTTARSSRRARSGRSSARARA